MIILDTNVISQFMGANRSPAVRDWFSTQQSEWLFTTSVNAGEICFGIESLPAGRRRDALEGDFRAFLQLVIGPRLLPFDDDSAREWGRLRALARQRGAPLAMSDSMIAAIASARGFAVATRKTRDFEGLGLTLIDPFADEERP